jgi:hypothetical protein
MPVTAGAMNTNDAGISRAVAGQHIGFCLTINVLREKTQRIIIRCLSGLIPARVLLTPHILLGFWLWRIPFPLI